VQLGMARVLAREGKIVEAAPYFRQAAELDSEYRDALLELAGLYEKHGRTAEAIEVYNQFPENPAAQERVGTLLIASKQDAQAIPRLEGAYGKSPSSANRVALAQAYVFDNQSTKALPLLDKAVAEEPGNFDLRLMYAHALRDAKQYPGAAR